MSSSVAWRLSTRSEQRSLMQRKSDGWYFCSASLCSPSTDPCEKVKLCRICVSVASSTACASLCWHWLWRLQVSDYQTLCEHFPLAIVITYSVRVVLGWEGKWRKCKKRSQREDGEGRHEGVGRIRTYPRLKVMLREERRWKMIQKRTQS